mmetsp:Transcript_8102/g.16502  ORF Transcript_8102/g.16502 Transcript_8102/m.16502 type:complete len:429 (-) Transcript_8102:88-1374(-)
MTSLQSTPTKPSAPTFETPRFIHKFGYHLARQLLGTSSVNNCLREADESLQRIDGRQKNQTHTFRANWRGPATKFPWMLAQSQANDSSWRVDGKVIPESLFVDVTFDFLVFPYEVTEEGRTSFCHVVKSDEWEQDDCDKDKSESPRLISADEKRLLSLSVAIRLGAFIAVPDNKETISSGKDDNYRYYYQRGNPLTGPDVYEHCRGIDIVPEEMDASQIADIIAKALSNDDGRVVIELNDENACTAAASISAFPLSQSLDTTNDNSKKRWYWKLELHHQELEGKGTLPLKTYDHTHVFSKAYDDQNWGTPIDHSVLDTFLLNNQGQRCVPIPANVAKLVWDEFDPALLESLKEPVKPSPRKPAAVNPYAKKPSPPKAEEENKRDGNTKPKVRKASPVKKDTALFAKGKRTTVAGQKRKKPKFTIGPPK